MRIRIDILSKKLNAKLYGNNNAFVSSVASLNSAQKGQITFFSGTRYVEKLSRCKATAIVVKKKEFLKYNNSISILVVQDPYLAYVKLAKIFSIVQKPSYNIHCSAVVSIHGVIIGSEVSIGANTVIESGAVLGDYVSIGSNCYIGKNSNIGKCTQLWSNVSIYPRTIIGEKCLIQSGAVIGSDGFGYINRNKIWIKIPQLGKVIIGDNVEIGACTTIDRGAIDDTVIKNGVIIDNLCQIAHNVVIEENTAVAGGVVIAGSVTIGKNCMVGGASVINGHIEICDEVIITGMSMVMRSIKKPGTYSSGIPSQSNKSWKKTAVLVMNIDKIFKDLKKLKKKVFSK